MIRNFLYVIIVVLASACSNSNSRTKQISDFVDSKIGETICLPDSFFLHNLEIDTTYSFTYSKPFVYCARYRIATFINGDCHACVNQLKKWKEIIKLFNENEVRFLFFIFSENYAAFELMNNREIHFKYPVIYDYKNAFKTENNIPQDYLLNSILINKENKIVLVGNPTISEDILKLYKKEIKQY